MAHRTTSPIDLHNVHSATLMEHAKEQLALGDRLQASEKAWGAFAHALKVVADERHWEYSDHVQVNPIVMALVEESENPELRHEAYMAQHLHTNYYRDAVRIEDIALLHTDVESAIDKLQRISQRYQDDPEYLKHADELRPPNSRYDVRSRSWERITPDSDAPAGPK